MTSAFTRDAIERIVWTAIQAFVASLVASGLLDGLGLSWTDSLEIAGLAALLSLAKSILALNIGAKGTAQLGTETYVNETTPTT